MTFWKTARPATGRGCRQCGHARRLHVPAGCVGAGDGTDGRCHCDHYLGRPRQQPEKRGVEPAVGANKYHARRCHHASVILGDHLHDSEAERARCYVLEVQQTRGEISNLRLRPKFPLVVNGVQIATYEADWSYDRAGWRVVEDRKGYRTPVYQLKKRLVFALYNVTILET